MAAAVGMFGGGLLNSVEVSGASTFESPPTTSFLNLVHRKFIELVRALYGHLQFPLFSLSLHMVFGDGRSSSSRMHAQPIANTDDDHVDNLMMISNHASGFVEWIQSRFPTLLRTMMIFSQLRVGQMTSLTVDLGIGFVTSLSSTMRITIPCLTMAMTNSPSAQGPQPPPPNGPFDFRPIPKGTTWASVFGSMTETHDRSDIMTDSSSTMGSHADLDDCEEPADLVDWRPPPLGASFSDLMRR